MKTNVVAERVSNNVRSDYLGDSKNFTIVRLWNPLLKFPEHSKNFTNSFGLLCLRRPHSPAGLVLVLVNLTFFGTPIFFALARGCLFFSKFSRKPVWIFIFSNLGGGKNPVFKEGSYSNTLVQ